MFHYVPFIFIIFHSCSFYFKLHPMISHLSPLIWIQHDGNWQNIIIHYPHMSTLFHILVLCCFVFWFYSSISSTDRICSTHVLPCIATSISWKAIETYRNHMKPYRRQMNIMLPERKASAVRGRYIPWLQAGVSKNRSGCNFWFKEGSYMQLPYVLPLCQHIIWSYLHNLS